MKRLGFAVSLLRVHYGIGIRDLAKAVGISSATLSRIENGKPATADSFMKLLNWLADKGEMPKGTRFARRSKETEPVAMIRSRILIPDSQIK